MDFLEEIATQELEWRIATLELRLGAEEGDQSVLDHVEAVEHRLRDVCAKYPGLQAFTSACTYAAVFRIPSRTTWRPPCQRIQTPQLEMCAQMRRYC